MRCVAEVERAYEHSVLLLTEMAKESRVIA